MSAYLTTLEVQPTMVENATTRKVLVNPGHVIAIFLAQVPFWKSHFPGLPSNAASKMPQQLANIIKKQIII
jgi:hypothetical protein